MTTAAALGASITTSDGIPLRVRPIAADDGERERHFIKSLSAESRYNRLMYQLREPSSGFVRQLTTIDHVNTMALVVVDPIDACERFIAVARYARDPRIDAAEFALTVADAWQRRRIGSQLARALFRHAASQGISRIYGYILANNDGMLSLVRALGMTIRAAPNEPQLMLASIELTAAKQHP